MEHAYGLATERRSNCKRDSAVADEFDRWLGSADERPVFAYFHLMSPHLPYLPPGVEHDFPADEQVALLLETEALPADRLALLREGGFDTYMLYRDGRKYLESSSGVGEETVVEFYDLRSDAGESRNLGVSGSVGVVAAEAWSAELAELRRLANSERVAGDKIDIDPASVERLKALGYMN
jgi:hypothetical protein